MLTNHTDITVFCSKQIGRETLWFAKQLKDVNFYSSDSIAVGNKEVTRADEGIIRIPGAALKNSGYVDNSTWMTLSVDETFDKFTLKKGDYVAKGLIDDDVSTSAEIIKKYEAYQITAVSVNLSTSDFSKHIKLVVK